MNDGFVVDSDIAFASAIAYAVGFENLVSVEYVSDESPRGYKVVMKFNIASEDGNIMRQEWDGRNFAVADLKSYSETYSRITRVLKRMDKDGQTLWRHDDLWVRLTRRRTWKQF